MSKLIGTHDFTDVSQLEYALEVLMDDEIACGSDYPVILVEDANGNPLSHLDLYEETLTDGSKVYKIVLGRTGA